MDIEESKKIVTAIISKIINNKKIKISEDIKLIGSESPLDSMKLVETCLSLEDKAEELGFEFVWTSNATMSKSNSIFKNLTSLSEEFLKQSKKRDK